MANYFVQALEELEARINVVWTDRNLTFYDTQTKNVNWRVLIDEMTALQAPWVVIMAGTAVPDDDSAVNATASVVPLTIFYIRSSSPTVAEDAADERIEESVYQKMHDLMTDLFPTDPTVHTALQVTETPSVDVSPNNPANRVFVEASAPFIAGALTIMARMGQNVA